MTPKLLKLAGLSDAELREVAALAIEEARHREHRRKMEIIARIKALAAEGRLSVTINLQAVKPKKGKGSVKTGR
jgi:hypothetical protein